VQHIHFTHTLSGKPDGVALHYTCPTPEACALGQPARQASALVHEGGTCRLAKITMKKEVDVDFFVIL